MPKKMRRNSTEELFYKRRKVGIMALIFLVLSIGIIWGGYRIWLFYSNSPQKIAQNFIDAFSEYKSAEMRTYSTLQFWKKEGSYYEAISHALGALADNVAKAKGLPVAMLKPQLKIVIPEIEDWKTEKTATQYIFNYSGTVTLTFPESQTLPNSEVDIHATLKLTLCKDNKGWKVCNFERMRNYADWAVYEFLEARMAADTDHLETLICSQPDISIKDYIAAYDIMVHDPAGDSNYAWIISHIANIEVEGNQAVVNYGLYKVSNQDPTKPLFKWKYVDVKEQLTLCKEDGLWYIKGIHFEE